MQKRGNRYMDYSTINFKYQLYLESVMRNQSDIIRYTNECVCLESGDLAAIQSINESAIDTIKAAIRKILSAIASIWKKFVERANELLTTDLAYLEKYKNIILNKPPKSKDITMYKYDHDALKIPVPQFDYNNAKLQEWLHIESSEEAEKQFASYFLGSAKVNTDLDLKEAFEQRIRGENQVEIDGKNLDMKKLYDFCVNYKNTVKIIENDTNIIAKSEGLVNKILGDLASKIRDEDNKPSNQNDNDTNTNNKPITNNSKLAESRIVYSNVYGAYITEADKQVIGATKEDKSSSDNKATGNSIVNNGLSNKTGNLSKNIASDMNGIADKNKKNFDAISKNAAVFFRCCGNIVAAKQTVCQEMQKNYMAIIRAHVRDYVGEK